MINVGIIGGAGYTAGELIRILVNHPEVNLKWIHSNSNAGQPVTAVHSGLIGDTDLSFTDAYDFDNIDVMFMCSGHGASTKFMNENAVPESLRIVDLSQDFRDETNGFIYGLPEINAKLTKGALRVANPGCFATAIQLAILPAVTAGCIDGEIHVTAVTGSTGAGVKPTSKTHFSWRTDNLSTYKEFEHQHLLEIGRTVSKHTPLDKTVPTINFVPVRGDFARGIFASVYFDTDFSAEQLTELYKSFYSDAKFTHVVDFDLDLKQVVNTNKALISITKHGRKAHVVSVIDNLLKGASGQAVQNMNIMFDLDQTCGLRLKASGF
ncbi:MAG: N-acetyl-gamma-glutamyl-phosphate reductase [Muribaculaceae bacterium]|nr:N-acetyl-gamma-glutamyl-phosphate reductase [Muribaculaceae bacterium]